MPGLDIRSEQPGDYRIVEELTREAFWNRYVPEIDECLLVHKLCVCPMPIPGAFGRIAGTILPVD